MPEHCPEVQVVVDYPVDCSRDLQAVTSWTLRIEDTNDGRPNLPYFVTDADIARRNIAQVTDSTHNSC